MPSLPVTCPDCQSERLYRNGLSRSGAQRYRCRDCSRFFQHQYTYPGHRPDVREQVVDMAMNGSGVRDTARVLGMSHTTVIKILKNSPRPHKAH